jgi:hypothetical protein
MNTNSNLVSRKSPLALARQALEDAQRAIPAYSSKFSRHDYTQHQLHALLALRRALRTDYRGLEALLRDWPELRETLGLERVPDHSTLQRAARRLESERRKARARSARNANTASSSEQPSPAPSKPEGVGSDGDSLYAWGGEGRSLEDTSEGGFSGPASSSSPGCCTG